MLTTDQIYRLHSIRVRSDPYRSLDFIALNNNYNDRFQVQIDRETRQKVLNLIRKDVEFLASCQVMGYALLLGIEEVTGRTSQKSVRSTSNLIKSQSLVPREFQSMCGNFIFHIKIIDYLQSFDLGKKYRWYMATRKADEQANEPPR